MTTLLWILCWIVFSAAALLLIVVILLQESKGGGLAEAFGGIGAETFGVKSGGINRVTFTIAAVFMACAILLQALWNAG